MEIITCTIPFTDLDGNRHNEGDVVRTFDVKSRTMLNLKTAKDIFEKRIGGFASMPAKGNRPFILKSVYETEGPRPSVFSDMEKLHRIF